MISVNSYVYICNLRIMYSILGDYGGFCKSSAILTMSRTVIGESVDIVLEYVLIEIY